MEKTHLKLLRRKLEIYRLKAKSLVIKLESCDFLGQDIHYTLGYNIFCVMVFYIKNYLKKKSRLFIDRMNLNSLLFSQLSTNFKL